MIPTELQIMPAARHFENDWVGREYKLGGITADGVDCYGLVILWYREILGVEIPDPYQHEDGEKTFMDCFRPVVDGETRLIGDVVVLDLGKWSGHVGLISTNKAKMLQASRAGVVISSMGAGRRHNIFRLKERAA